MDFWQILVFAVVKKGVDIDFDRLANLASNHRDMRRLAGYSDTDRPPISAATLVNNLTLLSDDVVEKINLAMVKWGITLSVT